MTQVITFDTMPQAMAYLIKEIQDLKEQLLKPTMIQAPVDQWFSLDELINYLPDKPVKATVYGWVHYKSIPYHKGGKRLRFLKSDIDKWMSEGKRKSTGELTKEASNYCSKK